MGLKINALTLNLLHLKDGDFQMASPRKHLAMHVRTHVRSPIPLLSTTPFSQSFPLTPWGSYIVINEPPTSSATSAPPHLLLPWSSHSSKWRVHTEFVTTTPFTPAFSTSTSDLPEAEVQTLTLSSTPLFVNIPHPTLREIQWLPM